jgi:hypothetical protein
MDISRYMLLSLYEMVYKIWFYGNVNLFDMLYWNNESQGRFAHICIVTVALGGLVVSLLATGPKVRGLGRGRWILRVIKSAVRLPSEGK